MRAWHTYRGARRNLSRALKTLWAWRTAGYDPIVVRVRRWIVKTSDNGVPKRVLEWVQRTTYRHWSYANSASLVVDAGGDPG